MLTAITALLALHGAYQGTELCAQYKCHKIQTPPVAASFCDLKAQINPNATFGAVAGAASFLGAAYTLNWVRTGDLNLISGSRGNHSLNLWLDAQHHLYKVVLEKRLPDGRWTWATCAYR